MKFNNKTAPKDDQDAFNRAYERLITHADVQRCLSKFGGCQYRRGQNACAIGYMMPDKMARMGDRKGQGGGGSWGYIQKVVDNYSTAANWFKNVTTSLLTELQEVHDGNGYVGKGNDNYINKKLALKQLKAIAKIYKLKMPKIHKPKVKKNP